MNIAQAYARALYEKSGSSLNPAQVSETLESFAGMMDESKELNVALLGTATSLKEKEEIVSELVQAAKVETHLGNFLKLLARKGRLGILRKIQKEVRRVSCEAKGGVLGELVSADELKDNEIQEFEKVFTSKLGKNVEFETKQDSTLLAGVKVTVDGVTYDGSLRSELSRLKDSFIEGEFSPKIFNGNNGVGTA